MDEKTILQQGFATSEAETGLQRVQTPEGFALYLSLIAVMPGGIPDTLSGRSWAQFNDDNDVSSTDWNAYRDRYAYCCLLGEWDCADQLQQGSAYRQRWFGADVEVLQIGGTPWKARHTVNEIVREEMKGLVPGAKGDAALTEFLQQCFQVMAHQIAGVPSKAYYKKLAAAQENSLTEMSPDLHALLRKESIFLWTALKQRPHRVRNAKLQSILTQTADLTAR